MRARRRRAQRLRGVVAITLGAVGVGAAVASTSQIPIPGLDRIITVEDTAAMRPMPDEERRTRPPLAVPRTPGTE